MGNIDKEISLLLVVILAVSSLMMVESASAQSIPKPSVPEFTVRFVDNSYDVEPRYYYDPYTGKDVLAENGYHVQNKTIELKIRNQPLISAHDSYGNVLRLYYRVQNKGYFGGSWFDLHGGGGDYYPDYYYIGPVSPTDEYILKLYGLAGNNGTLSLQNLDISDGGKADFRVQAFIGYVNRTKFWGILGESHEDIFTGETSDWSNTQTLSIPDGSVSASTPSPTTPTTSAPTSTITTTSPDANGNSITLPLNILIIIIAAILLLAVTLSVLLFSRHRKTAKLNH
jgi:hypothetical protein